MNKIVKDKFGISKILIAAVLVVVLIVGAAGAYYLSTQGSAQTNPTSTQTPAGTENPVASATPTQTTTSSSSSNPSVSSASSLKYKVSLTENGQVQGTYTYQGKNAGTGNFMLRIDYTGPDGEQAFIFNGAQRKAWTYENEAWTDISSAYDTQFTMWNNLWNAYNTNLVAWTGAGDYVYTQDGTTVRIFDIQVNPSLDDSLFTH